MRRVTLSVLVAVATLGVAGCGSSRGTTPAGGHAYVVAPTGNQTGFPTKGFSITLVSPVAIPANVLKTRDSRLVAQANGPEVCSYTKPVEGLSGEVASVNGKTLTLTVNGSNPITAAICSALKNERMFPGILGGKVPPPVANAKYSVRQVKSAFGDHGIQLTRATQVEPGFVSLADGHQVAVAVLVNPQRRGAVYGEMGPGNFRRSRKGNVFVGYRPAHADAVSAALAELGS